MVDQNSLGLTPDSIHNQLHPNQNIKQTDNIPTVRTHKNTEI